MCKNDFFFFVFRETNIKTNKIFKNTCLTHKFIVEYIRAIKEMEAGQDRKIAALTYLFYVHFYFIK